MQAGDKVLMNFPAANRDPEPHSSTPNRSSSTGPTTATWPSARASTAAPGPTWPAWSSRVAIEEWLRRIPEFRIEDGAEVTWAGGQVRGPRSVPVVFP